MIRAPVSSAIDVFVVNLPPARAIEMSFFVTSVRKGDGGNLGGLAGEDDHCLKLAAAAGSTKHEWRALLESGSSPQAAIDARDRIARGPWFNPQASRLQPVSTTCTDRATARREDVSRRARKFCPRERPRHSTGSKADGTVADWRFDLRNWTSTEGHAMVGHSNKVGSLGGDRVRSWNSAHLSGAAVSLRSRSSEVARGFTVLRWTEARRAVAPPRRIW